MDVLLLTYLRDRISALRRHLAQQRDDGYSTETVVVAAMLVVLALGVIGILTAKVIAKANSINLDAP